MKKFKNIVFLFLAAGIFSSCTKNFETTNIDPSEPTLVTIQPMVNQVISTLFLEWQEQASAFNDWEYPASQLLARSAGSGFVLENASNELWSDYYSTLQNINAAQDIIDGTEDQESMKNIQAILNILKSYKTLHLTNQMGDVPYFNAGRAYKGEIQNYRPAYDDQQAIYEDILEKLDWASKNIELDASAKTAEGNSLVSLGGSDTFFGGDMERWQRFGNALLLRAAMQIVEVEEATAAPYIKEIIENDLPLIEVGLENNGDVGMWPTALDGSSIESTNWSFREGKFARMSSTFWDMVSNGLNDGDIFDPRARLWVEPNEAGAWAPYTIGSGASDGANPYQQARRENISDKDGVLFSPVNFYVIGDESYLPEIIISAAETHFLKAEAYARGIGVSKNMNKAEEEYYAGIEASVDYWFDLAHNTNTSFVNWAAVAPAAPTTPEMTAFLSDPKVNFSGTDEEKLDMIYAQEWLSFFRQPWLAFNLWRRTDRTPKDPNANMADFDTFYRIPYPQSESVDNPENFNAQKSKMGGNDTRIKVWWMP